MLEQHLGISLRAGHRRNCPAERMVLLALFDYLKKRFSYKEIQFKTFGPVMILTSCLLLKIGRFSHTTTVTATRPN